MLFVGKIARGGDNLGKLASNNFIDTTETADGLFYNVAWPYWSYTKSIVDGIFEENLWENISLTNCIKCVNSSVQDSSSVIQKENCLNKIGVLWKEIELLKPHKIIFYTGWNFDKYIDEFRTMKNFLERTDKSYTTRIGKNDMPWWERTYYQDNDTVKILRVGHPERKKKIEFVEKIINWINNG